MSFSFLYKIETVICILRILALSFLSLFQHSTRQSEDMVDHPLVQNSRFLWVFQLKTTITCADNIEAKSLCIISVKGIKGRQNRLPVAGVDDADGHTQEMQTRAQKEGTSGSGNSTMKIILQKRWCVYFEDNAEVIVNF